MTIHEHIELPMVNSHLMFKPVEREFWKQGGPSLSPPKPFVLGILVPSYMIAKREGKQNLIQRTQKYTGCPRNTIASRNMFIINK